MTVGGAVESVDSQLAALRLITEVGLARVDGKLEVLTERDRSAALLEEQHRRSIETLNERVAAQDKKISKAVGVAIGVSGALSSASGLLLWSLSNHR